jgi:hypothetical protein
MLDYQDDDTKLIVNLNYHKVNFFILIEDYSDFFCFVLHLLLLLFSSCFINYTLISASVK